MPLFLLFDNSAKVFVFLYQKLCTFASVMHLLLLLRFSRRPQLPCAVIDGLLSVCLQILKKELFLCYLSLSLAENLGGEGGREQVKLGRSAAEKSNRLLMFCFQDNLPNISTIKKSQKSVDLRFQTTKSSLIDGFWVSKWWNLGRRLS